MKILDQVYVCQFFLRYPLHGSFLGRDEFSFKSVRGEKKNDIASSFDRELLDAAEPGIEDGQSRFFFYLADDGVNDRLAGFDMPAGEGVAFPVFF